MTYQPLRHPPRFKEGDIVKLNNGNAPQIVMAVERWPRSVNSEWGIRARYYHSWDRDRDPNDNYNKILRSELDYQLYVGDPEEYQNPYSKKKEDKMNKNTLYQTKNETPRFGTYLATDSLGKIVLEMKGESGKLESFNKDDIEEVVPYTIRVNLSNGGSIDYECPKDKLKKGDLLWFPGKASFAAVTDVNTKHKDASPFPDNVRRILSEEI